MSAVAGEKGEEGEEDEEGEGHSKAIDKFSSFYTIRWMRNEEFYRSNGMQPGTSDNRLCIGRTLCNGF